MAGRDYKKYIRSAFAPIANLAGRESALDEFTTTDLPEERREEQFRLFRKIEVDRSKVIPLSGGGFLTVIKDEERELVLVSSVLLSNIECENLLSTCEKNLVLIPQEYEEAIFLIAATEFNNFLRLSDGIRSKEAAIDFLDIVDQNYKGHDFYGLKDAYNSILVMECDKDNPLYNSEISNVTLAILSNIKELWSPIIDEEVGDAICKLRDIEWVDKSSLLQALTSSQWRHVFLEVYRCLESVFYFPWIRDFKKNGKINGRNRDILKLCREELKWFAKEEKSIARLFEMIHTDELEKLERRIAKLSEIQGNEEHKRSSFGRKLYSIRNTLVHHENKESTNIEYLTHEEIRDFTLYLAQFIHDFDASYGREFVN